MQTFFCHSDDSTAGTDCPSCSTQEVEEAGRRRDIRMKAAAEMEETEQKRENKTTAGVKEEALPLPPPEIVLLNGKPASQGNHLIKRFSN